MPIARSRKPFALLLPAIFGLLFSACSGSDGDGLPEHLVSGHITFKRLPIKTDASGYPLGLDAPDKAETLPLRGITVRAVWKDQETMPDGSSVDVWRAGNPTTTTADGIYSLGLPSNEDLPVYIEVSSVLFFDFGTGGRCSVRVVADPDGMNSHEPQADRVLYSVRRGLDGSAPEGDPTPAVAKAGRVALNIEVGLDDRWWVGHPGVKFAPDAVLESDGTGSSVVAILDTAFRALAAFGDHTPGGTLDLHYRRGVTEPFGTYVEYDLERFSAAFDPSGMHYFGSVRGGPQHDDAWDEGTLLSMMARNNLRRSGIPTRFQLPPKKFPGFDPRNQQLSAHLQPTMAMAEGLPDAMAAVLLKTPYLTSASGTIVQDVRDLTGLPLDVFSGPAIAAFAWDLALKVSGVDAPGTPEAWESIEIDSIVPLFLLSYASETEEDRDFPTHSDLPSLFTQLVYMTSTYGELLTDDLLAQMARPYFGAIWPRPEEGPLSSFIADWGSDPDSGKKPIPGFSFSMTDAVMDAEGRFSNLTAKENFTAKLTLDKDTAYMLSVTPAPSLPSGTAVECRISECVYSSSSAATAENQLRPLFFGQAQPNPQRVILRGKSDGTIYHLLHFSLKSPATRAPDAQIAVRLDPAY